MGIEDLIKEGGCSSQTPVKKKGYDDIQCSDLSEEEDDGDKIKVKPKKSKMNKLSMKSRKNKQSMKSRKKNMSKTRKSNEKTRKSKEKEPKSTIKEPKSMVKEAKSKKEEPEKKEEEKKAPESSGNVEKENIPKVAPKQLSEKASVPFLTASQSATSQTLVVDENKEKKEKSGCCAIL